MARVLRMLTTSELPARHPRRLFAEQLFSYYRDAGRPPLRVLAEEIAADPKSDSFTVSRETIRKTLRGESIPTTFDVVNAVFIRLCRRAGVNPDVSPWEELEQDPPTHREYLRKLWNDALDSPPPAPAAGGGQGGAGYSNKPPF